MNRKTLVWLLIITHVEFFIFGIFVHMYFAKTETKTQIKYETLPPIHDTINIDSNVPPPKETQPLNPEYIYKCDTLYKDSIVYVAQEVDTAAILADWIKKREYDIELFDKPDVGKLHIYPTVQYNKLSSVAYDFIPIQKTVQKTKTPLFEPFVMTGISNKLNLTIEAGAFIKQDFGVSYQFINDNDKQHFLKIGYKF